MTVIVSDEEQPISRPISSPDFLDQMDVVVATHLAENHIPLFDVFWGCFRDRGDGDFLAALDAGSHAVAVDFSGDGFARV